MSRTDGSASSPRRVSFAGRLTAGVLGVLVVMAALAAAAVAVRDRLELTPFSVFLLTLLGGIPLGVWMVGRLTGPLTRTLQNLSDGIRSFHDRDFSTRLATGRKDELGDLARLYNEVADTLRDERKHVREKELLLQTALNQSPAAIILVNPLDRVIYGNREARRLLLGGTRLEGYRFDELRRGCPAQMREVLASDTDGVFTVSHEESIETYHISQRTFLLNRRRHTLVLVRRMTGELGRQEAEIWKKVIRVISHELNNSLAPISSLIHSAQAASRDPRHAHRSETIFGSIAERVDHLKRFITGYARFARLPRPRREDVEWAGFLDSLGEFPSLTIEGRLPAHPARIDPAQMRQVLVNLIKNAFEASDGEPRVSLRISDAGDEGTFLQVMDRGQGMDEQTMKKALLPFYSTKKTGSGLGLPLCREILEAHGGRISLQAQEGGGTVVTCWLPPSTQPAAQHPA